MPYLLWSLPTLIVIAAIASGRASTVQAALLGLLASAPVALLAGPDTAFGMVPLWQALLRGLWIGATIAPYILGGLLFWQVAAHGAARTQPGGLHDAGPQTVLERRRLVFFASFMVGPFAESATGFGVGMLATVAMLRPLGLAPRHLMVFALLSQTLIPWGAMGSGTMLAAAYTRMPASQLALYSLPLVALLMVLWLALFWRTARLAGLGQAPAECAREAAWTACGLALLSAATHFLGPETALLAAYGPLIVARHLADQPPQARAQLRRTLRSVLPYALLIVLLVLTRMPGVAGWLEPLARVAPFADLPAWSPLLHAGSWLAAAALLTALWLRQPQLLKKEALASWATGRNAVATVFLFAMMAELLSAAGISRAFAQGLFGAMQEHAVLVTPLLSGIFGILANSGNAPNSLFMPSQIALAAQAGLNVLAVAAIQHVSGTSMSLFSPVRMSMAAGLAQGTGQERRVYAYLLPYALAAVLLLCLAASAAVLLRAQTFQQAATNLACVPST